MPRHLQGFAYVDEDIHLGKGRWLREPVIIARLIQEAGVLKSDIVLDIGCNTGYTTAVLGHLAGMVVGLEIDEQLAKEADKLLHDLDIVNAVVVRQPKLVEGYAQQGPYNVILHQRLGSGGAGSDPQPAVQWRQACHRFVRQRQYGAGDRDDAPWRQFLHARAVRRSHADADRFRSREKIRLLRPV